MNLNPDVSELIQALKHPLSSDIDRLRSLILRTEPKLTEYIKWNSPNYAVGDQDRITMKIQPPKHIQLIFHCGAKVQKPRADKLIRDTSDLLEWRGNDRAIVTFKNSAQVEASKKQIAEIVKLWIDSSCRKD